MLACGLRVGLRTWTRRLVVGLWCSAARRPRSSSNDAVCVVVRSRSTSGQHVFVKSSNSFTFSLCEGSLAGQLLGLVLSVALLASDVSLVSHASFVALVSNSLRFRESASFCASSVDNSSCDVRSHLFSMRSLLTPSETCLSISPIRPFTLLNDSLSVTFKTKMMSCTFLFQLSTYPGS